MVEFAKGGRPRPQYVRYDAMILPCAFDKLRAFVAAVKDLAPNVRVRPTKRNSYLEVLAGQDDDSSGGKAMVFRRDGIIRPHAATRLRAAGVPQEVIATYWREMGAIAPEFEPGVSATGNDLGKLLTIDQVVTHRDAFWRCSSDLRMTSRPVAKFNLEVTVALRGWRSIPPATWSSSRRSVELTT